MKLTYDPHEFIRQTGAIFDGARVRQLGLEPSHFTGYFRPSDMDDVLDFCAKNPEFHIVSNLGDGIYVNRYDERGICFRVADGDNDPELAMNAIYDMQRTLAVLGFKRKGA